MVSQRVEQKQIDISLTFLKVGKVENMTGYKLTMEKQAPIGDGFDIAIKNMEWCKAHVMELKALLSYKDTKMIEANKTRALCDIETVIDGMEDIKRMIDD